MPTARFALKDELFNLETVTTAADQIAAVYPDFQTQQFIEAVTKEFPQLELMARLYWIRECLLTYLPADYRTAVNILLKSLPAPLDPERSDGDFGGYVQRAYGDFVAHYGATQKDVQFSLEALRVMTSRFSCEFAIRPFINQFPEETLAAFELWLNDEHYHVRRLISEGTRARLPWAKNIELDYKAPLPFLAVLHSDKTRFVTRSVANHLNDISKVDPELVLTSLQQWQKTTSQEPAEFAFIQRHALRSLLKKGHPGALQLLGYGPAAITAQLRIQTPQVKIGEELLFSGSVTSLSDKDQLLLIDYNLYFQKANGQLAPKTFKISKINLAAGETVSFTKSQSFALMSTRQLHIGRHQVELQINGQKLGKQDFGLVH